MEEINDWWRTNKEQGRVSVLAAYSLGKAQRIINNVDHSIGKIYTHGAVENVNEVIRRQGKHLHETHRVKQGQKRSLYDGNLIIAPPSSVDEWPTLRDQSNRGREDLCYPWVHRYIQ